MSVISLHEYAAEKGSLTCGPGEGIGVKRRLLAKRFDLTKTRQTDSQRVTLNQIFKIRSPSDGRRGREEGIYAHYRKQTFPCRVWKHAGEILLDALLAGQLSAALDLLVTACSAAGT